MDTDKPHYRSAQNQFSGIDFEYTLSSLQCVVPRRRDEAIRVHPWLKNQQAETDTLGLITEPSQGHSENADGTGLRNRRTNPRSAIRNETDWLCVLCVSAPCSL